MSDDSLVKLMYLVLGYAGFRMLEHFVVGFVATVQEVYRRQK